MRKQSAVEVKEKNDDWFFNTSIGSPVVGIGFVGLVGLALYYGYIKKYKTVSGNTVPEGRNSVVPKATSKTNPEPQGET